MQHFHTLSTHYQRISFHSLQCPFIDVIREEHAEVTDDHFRDDLVEDALRALIESIRHRSGLLNIYKSTPNNAEPDIRQVFDLTSTL